MQDEARCAGPFGQRLRALRRAAGLTQEELAGRAGLTVNGVSALERGTRSRPYPHTVRSLSEALGLSPAEQEALAASVRARPAEPPPPGPDPGPPAALPPSATELVGRQVEVADLLRWLDDPSARLITLTGPGGVGKTRLAGEVALRSCAHGPGGVVFVGLASVADPARVLPTIAEALRLPETVPAAPAVAGALRGRQLLLLLDNLEQVLDAAPDVAALVASCPDLRVLVTSRAPLRVRGEREFQVRPLGLPASTRAPSPGEVTGCPAGALLVQRARAVQADFEVTSDNAAAVAAICRRLGGLPLALELAAPRLRSLAPQDLLVHLDQALTSGWARDLPARQQTMQATLDWSHELLEEQERTLLAHLAVFSGGFDLAAVQALARDVVEPGSVLGLLERLVEQSMVVVVRDRRGRTHYELLEPIRQYAARLLHRRGQEEAARRAHARYLLAVAEQAAPAHRGAGRALRPERAGWEDDDVRAAVAWAVDAGEAETAARLGWLVVADPRPTTQGHLLTAVRATRTGHARRGAAGGSSPRSG